MIDKSKFRLLTPDKAILNVKEELTLYYRNGEIITYTDDNSTSIDLHQIAGAQNHEFNLVFYNRDAAFIKNAQESEDYLQAIYSIFDFKVGGWVEVVELTPFEFLDTLYNEGESFDIKKSENFN